MYPNYFFHHYVVFQNTIPKNKIQNVFDALVLSGYPTKWVVAPKGFEALLRNEDPSFLDRDENQYLCVTTACYDNNITPLYFHSYNLPPLNPALYLAGMSRQ